MILLFFEMKILYLGTKSTKYRMRYADIISETITTKPRNLGLYVKNRIKDIETVISTFEAAEKIIESNVGGEDLLRRFLSYSDRNAADNIGFAMSRPKYLVRDFENLLSTLKSYLAHGPNFLRFILSVFDYTEFHLTELNAFFGVLNSAEAGADEYDIHLKDPDNIDEDYEEAMRLHKGLVLVKQAMTKGIATWEDIKTKLTTIDKMRADHYSPYRPEHDTVETLYHATAFVTEILSSGFKSEKPFDRKGLGTFGSQALISFTHDLEVARVIVRALKEIWMIVHGELKTHQLLRWIDNEGLADKIQPLFSKPLTSINTVGETITLHRYWLALSKLRVDPVFVSPDQLETMMKDRKLADIGVLACEVEIKPDDEYLIGEAEFRLPASQVISTTKIL